MKTKSTSTILVFVLAVGSLIACSNTNRDGNEALDSKMKSEISLAAESLLLIEQLEAGRITGSFASGHVGSLQQQVDKVAKELNKVKAQPGSRDVFDTCKRQLDDLRSALIRIQFSLQQRSELPVIRERIAHIQSELKNASQRP
jgi:hypothetical protein